MSRGGRGGSRGGGMRNPWQFDDLKIDSKPSELFPPYKIPIASPPGEQERREVAYYVELRDEIHQGPLYTKTLPRDPKKLKRIYGEDQDNEQYSRKTKADMDPFTGVPTYSMKYDQKQRTLPKLSGRPFNKELFPKELWATLYGEESDAVRSTINLSARRKAVGFSLDNPTEDLSSAGKKLSIFEKLKNVTDEDDDVDLDREEEEMQEEEDYDFEEDEDMGADYNGEKYFETGEDDEEVDGDGGGGGDDFA